MPISLQECSFNVVGEATRLTPAISCARKWRQICGCKFEDTFGCQLHRLCWAALPTPWTQNRGCGRRAFVRDLLAPLREGRPLLKKITMLSIRVADFERCVAWYRDILGLKPVGLHDDPFCLMVLPEDDTAFALDGTNPVLGSSNCIPNVLVDSLATTIAELKSKGVQLARDVQEDDEEGYAITTIKDCEGNLINIYENR
jgi:catechol 2,3-dioxygenase-like lactoylglutathione lyase family enzyme